MVKAFERAVLIEATRLRELFASRDQSYLSMTVTIDGPVDYESLKISFRVGNSGYGDSVEGDSVDNACDEFFRRKGWKAKHDTLLLPILDSHKEA
jgi:hypothetical protein